MAVLMTEVIQLFVVDVMHDFSEHSEDEVEQRCYAVVYYSLTRFPRSHSVD